MKSNLLFGTLCRRKSLKYGPNVPSSSGLINSDRSLLQEAYNRNASWNVMCKRKCLGLSILEYSPWCIYIGLGVDSLSTECSVRFQSLLSALWKSLLCESKVLKWISISWIFLLLFPSTGNSSGRTRAKIPGKTSCTVWVLLEYK